MKTTASLRSFLFVTAFLATMTTAHAQKTWKGTTSNLWTDGSNWSPSGAPTSGTVVFDGSGTNLNTILNGTARSLSSLSFTSGQTADVTITTTNTAALTLVSTGTSTTLDVLAGDHKFVGTNAGSGAAADFSFGGASGTTHVLSIASGASFEIAGRIVSGTSNNKIIRKTGTGTLILSGNNGGSGSWVAANGIQIQQGVLRITATNAGGNSNNNFSVTSGAVLELTGGISSGGTGSGTYTLSGTGIGDNGALRSTSGVNSLIGSGTGGIALSTNSSIGVDADSLTISDDVLGSGSLTKVGAGTLTLANAGNSYGGGTIVKNGTLNITGTITTSGAVSVGGDSTSFNAKLAGSGTVNGAVTVKAASGGGTAGSLNAGNSTLSNKVGKLTMGSSLIYESGSIFEWDLASSVNADGVGPDGIAGTDFDSVSVAGNIDVNSGAIFKVIFGSNVLSDLQNSNNAFWNTPNGTQTWNMAAIYGKAFNSGAFASVQTSTDVSVYGSFSITGTSLTWTAVPEPTSALAGLLMTAGLLRRRRA